MEGMTVNEIVAVVLLVLGGGGYALVLRRLFQLADRSDKRQDALDAKVQDLEVHLPKEYATKADLERQSAQLNQAIVNMETRLMRRLDDVFKYMNGK